MTGSTVAIGIVAHPARIDDANRLAADVAADVVLVDHDEFGERWNHQQVLAWLIDNTEADWLVVLEDDAIPHPQLRELLPGILDDSPDNRLVSLYLGTGRWAGLRGERADAHVGQLVADADRAGARWVVADSLWHAVAIAVDRIYAGSLLTHLQRDPRPTDRAAGAWAQRCRFPVRYTHPSLVDHRDGPRLVPNGAATVARHAWRKGW